MSLTEYQRRRRFAVTPEPRPGPPAVPAGGNRFVIQKHDASHIHYDLRLELDGALKSWACPNGLATPHDRKKLAVRVEDHPLEYIDFEGQIPEGEYGAGKVEIWDSGVFETFEDPAAALEKGVLTVILVGGKVSGEFSLVHMKDKGRNWLILLNKMELLNQDLRREGRAAAMPKRIHPMQAVLAPEPFGSPDYLYEIKFDGVRAVSFLAADGSLSIKSRNGNEQAFRYPELAGLGKTFLAGELVVDGEIVALDENGVSRFQLLQERMGLSAPGQIEQAREALPVQYYIFDILYLDGRDLTGLPLSRRKEILRRVFMPHKYIRLSEHVAAEGVQFFNAARDLGLEGVIAKRLSSSYQQKRSRDWQKIKAIRQQEFVIGGFTEPRGGRARFGALLLGYYREGRLVFAGQVGSGFSDDTLERLYQMMAPLEQPEPPYVEAVIPNQPVHWIKPQLVAEVKFTEWTREGALRHPVYLGLRDDILPEAVEREEDRSEDERKDRRAG
jgi:bifunctional non-homologous end joining protein LigD